MFFSSYGLRSFSILLLLFILFLIGLNGCTSLKPFGLFDRDRAAIACVTGSGPVVTKWTAIYTSSEKESDNTYTFFIVDQACNIDARNFPTNGIIPIQPFFDQ